MFLALKVKLPYLKRHSIFDRIAKWYLISDQKDKMENHISDQISLQTISFGSAPRPPPPSSSLDETLVNLEALFTGSLCALPPDNGPCLWDIEDALTPAKKTSLTQACVNYLSDIQSSCSVKNSSSSFAECENICGRLFHMYVLLGYAIFESHERTLYISRD